MKSEVRITGNQLQIVRVFDAPRPLVFSFWTRPEKLQQWTGCKDLIACEVETDFREGGSFTQKMQIKGAGEFTLTGHYDEIIEPERIAYHADMGVATTRVVIDFIEQGSQTRVVLTQEGLPDENLCKIVSQGTTESFDKLEGMLVAQVA